MILADRLEYFSISTDQAADVKQKLDAFEKSKLTLEDINEKAGIEGNRELVGFYFAHTNEITTLAKLPIGRSMAGFNMFSEAEMLGKQFVNVYSNDWRGWRLLGAVFDSLNRPDESIQAYSKAVKFGNREEEYEALAAIAIKYNRLDVIHGVISQLMFFKNAKQTPNENKLHLMSILLVYSMKTDQKSIFTDTLAGENMNDILQDSTIKYDVTNGCEYFEGGDIDKIRQQVKAAASDSNSASTNAPMPR